MRDIRVAARAGGHRTVPHTALDALNAGLRGRLLSPRDSGFDEACTPWNLAVERTPALVVQCLGVADIRRGVSFAAAHGLRLCLHAGGYGPAGRAICDDGLVIDVSRMRSVRVDPASRRAHVEGGARVSDVDHEAQAFGLATPLGATSGLGVAGLTLGGGVGWLTRRHGLTADNLVAADVVVATGALVHTDADHHPELLWALKGGGGGVLGVVTRLELALHPVGPDVLAGTLVYPLEQAVLVLRRYRDLLRELPRDASVWATLRAAPPLPFLPRRLHGQPVVLLSAFHAGPPELGMQALEPFRHLGRVLGEDLGVRSYLAWQRTFDPLLGPGKRNELRAHAFADLHDGALELAVEAMRGPPSPSCAVSLMLADGAVVDVGPEDTAYAARHARFLCAVHGRWQRAAQDETVRSWVRSLFLGLRPYAIGAPPTGWPGADERPDAIYGPNLRRMREVKAAWDPADVFRGAPGLAPRPLEDEPAALGEPPQRSS